MKMIKRIVAAILAVVMTLCIFAVSASAAPAAPEFKLSVKSQTSNTVVFELALLKGSFNSFDVEIKVSGPIGSCKEIKMTSEMMNLKNSVESGGNAFIPMTNIKTSMISFVSTKTISSAIPMFLITYSKSAKNVTLSDYRAVFSSCALTSGDQNIDLTSKVKVITGYIEFKNDSVSANYKQTKKIEYDSNYSANQIKWESSNTKVATVDENGNVKTVGTGSAKITAKSVDGKASAECNVTVKYSWWQWIIVIVLFGWIWY